MQALLTTLVCGLVVLTTLWIKTRLKNIPPGPPRLPILGNLHQFPSGSVISTFDKWHKKYGPIVGLSLGSQTLILLGNMEVAKELFGKRGRIYSSRPRMVMGNENLTQNKHTALLPYGPKWKIHNRIHNSILAAGKTQHYTELIEGESIRVLHHLMHTSEYNRCYTRFTSSIIFSLVYGKQLQGDEPEFHEMLQIAENFVAAIAGGTWLVDIFPFINRLPSFLNPWKRMGNRFHDRAMRLFESNATHAMGTKAWNFTKHVHAAEDTSGLTDREVLYMIGVLFEAGNDSTSTVLRFCTMAAILFPDAVKLAQAELDAVVGPSRLPSVDDLPQMPYVSAFINEVLRWRPITPGGVVHASSEDDIFMGYKIPRGSVLMFNHWSAHLDEKTYDDPLSFRPERWLENDNLPLHAFGYGRRVCPGQYVARKTLDVMIPRLLWAFDFEAGYENGVRAKIDPYNLQELGALLRPVPFPAIFKPRDEARRALIDKSFANRDANLDGILNRIETAISRGSEVK
ncbi:hypothetical protein UA08_09304 [Talaromyces atroroseus]|uniref:Cytochrome P450 n=1 Tax=Talaromyces atroroseus TaxID=1441469 RepID=A0A1Q5Q6H2_TALAT|nr:hypothetical protein UA08_09304 [Talaromyces atroroseus]OKL55442.1 hypothetical protein UA08_09304 [Talaromyces atroroseus]